MVLNYNLCIGIRATVFISQKSLLPGHARVRRNTNINAENSMLRLSSELNLFLFVRADTNSFVRNKFLRENAVVDKSRNVFTT